MDLQGRSQFESDVAAKVEELSARQRRELVQLMGNPPDPERITQADWDRWEREDREKWLLLLLLVFNASYAQHYRLAKGEPLNDEASAVMSAAGQLWATAQAERLSRGFAATSEEMFNASRGQWRATAQRGSIGGGELGIEPKPEAPGSPTNYSGNRGYAFTEEDLSDSLDGIFSDARAENVGVTETTSAASAGAEAAIVRTTGFSEQDTWFTEKDSKVCPICVPLHKQPRSLWAGYFPGGPPAHPRCVLPGNFVSAPGRIEAATESFYDGPCVEILFANRGRFSVTQNHPVLTSKGWVKAGDLREGDDLLYCTDTQRMASLVSPNGNDRPRLIEDVFESLHVTRGMSSASVPSSPADFHGDGNFLEGHIKVVGSNGFLGNDGDSTLCQHGYQKPFVGGLVRKPFLSQRGVNDLFPQRDLSSTRRVVGVSDLPLSLRSGHRLPLEGFRFALSSRSDSGLQQDATNHGAGDSSSLGNAVLGFTSHVAVNELLSDSNSPCAVDAAEMPHPFVDRDLRNTVLARKFLGRYASLVATTKIRKVRDFMYRGHVYDLQVADWELYTCNGVIVHNCRCWIQYAAERVGQLAGV